MDGMVNHRPSGMAKLATKGCAEESAKRFWRQNDGAVERVAGWLRDSDRRNGVMGPNTKAFGYKG